MSLSEEPPVFEAQQEAAACRSLLDRSFNQLDALIRRFSVASGFFDQLDRVEAIDNLSEDRVLTIQMCCRAQNDEKRRLRRIRIARPGHRQGAADVKSGAAEF